MSNEFEDESAQLLQPDEQYSAQGFYETDEEFIERQFKQSVNALERIHALSPGEFERLVRTPTRTDEERQLRSSHHTDIARRALIATQQHLLSEEEFNIWSGRRKEAGQPVKFRFERAYANICTPLISCQRGALTGIIRSYVRLQDELITELIETAQAASSAEELLQVERQARGYGIIDFEGYLTNPIMGWPCYPRSTGRYRGASRLRQCLEQRQSELLLPEEFIAELRQQLTYHPVTSYDAYRPQMPTSNTQTPRSIMKNNKTTVVDESTTPFQRMLKRIRSIFH